MNVSTGRAAPRGAGQRDDKTGRDDGERRPAVPSEGMPGQAVWPRQRVQFLTRFLFAALALLYFQAAPPHGSHWLSFDAVAWLMAAYAVFNALNLWDALGRRYGSWRCRLALVVDVFVVSVCLVNDPFDIPPPVLVYAAIVLGSGIVHGPRLLGEAVLLVAAAGTAALTVRFGGPGVMDSPGLWFLPLFIGLVVVYGYVLMLRIEQARARLERAGSVDPLTGLLNRRGLARAAEAMLGVLDQGADRIIVLFADVNGLEAVSDRRGQGEADRVLREIAGRLRGALRGRDLVARYDAKAFVVILSNTGTREAAGIVRQLQCEVWTLARELSAGFGITVGWVQAPAAGVDLETLLARVDGEMHRARVRRNRARRSGPESRPAVV